MWEAEMRGSWFKSSIGKKCSDTLSQKQLDMVMHTCNPSCVKIGGLWSKANCLQEV
jgi:hypothetical protein